MTYFQVLAGFVLLLGGAECLVRGAVGLARRLGISALVIGMTVVAIGTSAPELVVSVRAALGDAPGIALGNLVGSNIANVLLILGAAGLVAPVMASPDSRLHDALVLLGGSVLFAGLCWQGMLGLGSGLVLLAAFAGFLGFYYWRETRDNGAEARERVEEIEELSVLEESLWRAWLAVLVGLAGILFGADNLVDGGIEMARQFGVPEEVIGLTLIAVGTSLPELAASLVAAFRGHADVALGNVVGSNLFNILGVVGVVAVMTPLPVAAQIRHFDLWIMLAATGLVIPFLIGHWRFGARAAALFLTAYAGYIGVQAYGVARFLGNLGMGAAGGS